MNWHKTFSYDPISGVLTFLPKAETTGVDRRWNKLFANKPAGCVHGHGYGNSSRIRITLASGPVYAHKVAWEMTNGPIPEGMFVDHKDCNGLNNRIDNLRLATHAQNCMNRRTRKDNTSGLKGVSWNGFTWSAQIRVNGKNKVLGRYRSKGMAAVAYAKAALQLHGQFARLQ